MIKRLSYDPPKLTPGEATELCVYHLRTAAALFQLVPDDNNFSLNNEIDRQTFDGLMEIDCLPAKAWADMMYETYNRMKDHD